MKEAATAFPMSERTRQMTMSRLRRELSGCDDGEGQGWSAPDAEHGVDVDDATLADGFVHPEQQNAPEHEPAEEPAAHVACIYISGSSA